MKYERFEELPVWKAAIDLAVKVYSLTATESFKGHFSLRDQMERAAVSVSNNIAEGFERGTTKELLTFIYIARGSAGEVRSMLSLFEHLEPMNDLRSEISKLNSLSEGVSRQLRGWANSLQNSGIKGQRYLTDKGRRIAKAEAERKEFIDELKRLQDERIEKLQRGSKSD